MIRQNVDEENNPFCVIKAMLTFRHEWNISFMIFHEMGRSALNGSWTSESTGIKGQYYNILFSFCRTSLRNIVEWDTSCPSLLAMEHKENTIDETIYLIIINLASIETFNICYSKSRITKYISLQKGNVTGIKYNFD